jgi:putative metalloprotease
MKKLLPLSLALCLGACGAPSPMISTSNSNAGKSAAGSSFPTIGAASIGGAGASSTENKTGAAIDLLKAATVSDQELQNASLQMRAREDRKQSVAQAGNAYAQRLDRLTKKHVTENGLKLNFRVYLSPSINANASPDGSIRIYSGLMDKMTDAELLGVIGHEIGHVLHKHSLASLRTAYLASAGRKAAASSSGALGTLADSELGALAEAVFNAQFSQSQETESDDVALEFMKRHNYDARAMESAFRKLGNSGGGMLSSHPNSVARADRVRDKLSGK